MKNSEAVTLNYKYDTIMEAIMKGTIVAEEIKNKKYRITNFSVHAQPERACASLHIRAEKEVERPI